MSTDYNDAGPSRYTTDWASARVGTFATVLF